MLNLRRQATEFQRVREVNVFRAKVCAGIGDQVVERQAARHIASVFAKPGGNGADVQLPFVSQPQKACGFVERMDVFAL